MCSNVKAVWDYTGGFVAMGCVYIAGRITSNTSRDF